MLHSVLLLAAAVPSTVLAEEPPLIWQFTFNAQTQRISFDAWPYGKNGVNYEITSSSANTTFNPALTAGWLAAGGPTLGAGWDITPGASRVGERHTFEIKVWNDNGQDSEKKCLRVVRGSVLYEEEGIGECVLDGPAVSDWGMVLIVLLLLTGITVKFARRGANTAA